MSASDPLATALRLLTVRERSEADLTRRLQGKGFSADEIAAALERCRDFGYLDDRRFARERARVLLRDGRAVGRRLEWELRRQGVPAALIDEAVAAAHEDHPESEVLSELVTRRYPHYDHDAADQKEQRRVIQFLQRRGFALADILSVLKNKRQQG